MSRSPEPTLTELVIEDHIGVCGVRDDTRALAEAAAASQPPGRALDLGTGSGFVGLYLAQRGWQVDAVDISPRAVELARRNAQRNGIGLNVFQSDLLAAVAGPYDLIAFNPPMRPDENEFSRILTSLLRRSPAISGLLMRIVGSRFESGRHPFLASLLAQARPLLNPGGRILMGISEKEAKELAGLPGVRLAGVTPIPSMARQEIYEFQFEEAS